MKRVVAGAALLILALLVAVAVFMRTVEDDPAVWHVDPATTARTGKPNDVLVAPDGAASATTSWQSKVHRLAPRDLLFLFDAVARNASRTTVLAGSIEDGHITYVQRSTVFGFPDYVSVRAVPVNDGAGLVIWSRSRFGHSDLGANSARITRWLAQIGDHPA